MNEEVKPDLIKPTPMRKLVGLYVAVLLAVFLLGLVPMWLKARASNSRLAQARHQLTLVGMQNNLATAVIDARRGDYEPARQATSQFFTSLRVEIDSEEDSAFTAAQRETAKSLFSRRDEIITSLARGDVVSVDQLSDLYVSYRKNINGE
jgi:Tfp pilus assembly protein PilV